MKKVICINDNWQRSKYCEDKRGVSFGEVVTVIDDGLNQYLIPSYELLEYRGFWFAQQNFIPLSDIDETEMIREYKKETA